jgi:plasmid stabilization system protein ParE
MTSRTFSGIQRILRRGSWLNRRIRTWDTLAPRSMLAEARTFRVGDRFETYLIFYQPHEGRIEILRVLHGSQDLAALFERDGLE